ncbi:MAG: UDP-N-acetylmuramoyl-tripeptide--D-alanyl-D-alanine ligase [Chitinophagaceae bacterium]|nr:MAG: UDP-N-acetylmuramoyl-tripeptide--D-alanyl-D-alanine ligase [Chitinophagaceae bacterium]
MNIADLYNIYLQHPSVETDTRKIKKGDLFFALKGPNFNGNHYAQQALDAGAAYCICNEQVLEGSDKIILVDDVLYTLQQLAKHHRQQFTIPFIAITGSNGKTTTKELLSTVLATTFKTYTTEGNLNNHIGVPLTLLRIKTDAEMAVIEMGANHQKEIESYCAYCLPTHGLINNCGKAHLEGFGGEEGVRKGKGELFDFLRGTNGTAFVNADYDYLNKMSAGIASVITYGEKNGDLRGEITGSSNFLEVTITNGADIPKLSTQLVGDYNLPNILAAVCVGKAFNVVDDNIKEAIEQYRPSNSRSQLVQKGSNTIILDAYNANPTSMHAAVKNFANRPASNKILMLGGMMELGDTSQAEHTALMQLIGSFNWKEVVLVGKGFTNVPGGFHHFLTADEARDWYRQQQIEGAEILVKGSRSFQMEKVVD